MTVHTFRTPVRPGSPGKGFCLIGDCCGDGQRKNKHYRHVSVVFCFCFFSSPGIAMIVRPSVRPQFQTFSPKPLDQSRPNFMWNLLGVCSQHLGLMTKIAAMPIYGKNPSKIISRKRRPISSKIGM